MGRRYFTYLLFILLISCSPSNEKPFISFYEPAYLVIENVDAKDTSRFYGMYKRVFPTSIERTDTINLNAKQRYILEYSVQKPEKVYLYLDDSTYIPLFLTPSDSLHISFKTYSRQSPLQNIEFDGKLSSVNYYYLQKKADFGNSISQKRIDLQNPEYSLQQYKDSILSYIDIELNYLTKYAEHNNLPNWFQEYEKSEISYSIVSLLDIVYYRRDMLKKTTEIPNNYYDFLDEMLIDNPAAIFSSNYYYFLSSFFYHKYTSEEIKRLPVNQRLKKTVPRSFDLADSLLSKDVAEIYKLYSITNYALKRNDTELIKSLLTKLEDADYNEKYLKYIKDLLEKSVLLHQGDLAPEFYLLGDDNNYYGLKDFRGKIILLNFWFPGCLPCIKEVPYERRLVDSFGKDDFALLNICLFTEQDEWNNAIVKYDMAGINLFANENWKTVLSNNYYLRSYPHYTLIDRDGIVINNKCPKPSENLIEIIKKELYE